MNPYDQLDALEKAAKKNDAYGVRARNTLLGMCKGMFPTHTRLDPDYDKNPKRLELLADVETMLQDSLVRRFKRNHLNLWEKRQFNAVGDQSNNLDMIAIEDAKNIFIPSAAFDILSREELKAIVAHEIGHHLRLDGHPKAKKPWIKSTAEDFSDAFAVYITQDPESLKSALNKVNAYYKEHIARLQPYSIQTNQTKSKIAQRVNEWTRKTFEPYFGYKNLEDRQAYIDECARKITTEEGRESLAKELETTLEQRHRKTFPKQFSRELENSRSAHFHTR